MTTRRPKMMKQYKTKKPKKTISVSLDLEVIKALDRFAFELGISRSAAVEMNLRAVFGDTEMYKATVSELIARTVEVAEGGKGVGLGA